MFLITTADQRFWKTDEPIIFLGEWCKVFPERSIWENLNYEVLPYHWDNREKLYRDYVYLKHLYGKILSQLCNCLNKIHGENHTTRYWRIIVGPWLYFFIDSLYDRYQSILSVGTSGKVTNTFIAKYEYGQWMPKDFSEFHSFLFSDSYNHYLYSRIIQTLSLLPFEINEEKDKGIVTDHEKGLKEASIDIKSNIKKIAGCIVPDSLNRIVIESSHINVINKIKLQIALGQVPYLYIPRGDSPRSKIDFEKRKEICLNSSENEFIKLLSLLIPEQIPTCYLESYSLMKANAKKAFPSKPKIIFTENAVYHNEGFKVWAASSVENGTMLVGGQHGGLYGAGLLQANEDHEYEIFDKYYSWGWDDELREKIKPLPALKLNSSKKINPDKNGRILMVHTEFPRYAYALLSMPIATTGYNVYQGEILKFIKHLEIETQEHLLVRLFPTDYGFCLEEQFAFECPNIECYRGGKTMLNQLKGCRLFIGTYNATTFLEAFCANFPSVLFWNPKQWELRASAQPYFDKLRSVGILHDTPESAARLVNKIYVDPMSWWHQPEIQQVKNQFCSQFALTSENWLSEWKEEFLGLKSKWMKQHNNVLL